MRGCILAIGVLGGLALASAAAAAAAAPGAPLEQCRAQTQAKRLPEAKLACDQAVTPDAP